MVLESTLPVLEAHTLNPPLNVTVVTDDAGLQGMSEYLQTVQVLGYDIETNIADRFTGRKIRTIQVGDKNRQFVIDLLAFGGSEAAMLEQGHRTAPVWAQSLRNALQPIVEGGEYLKVGHNLAFEHETFLWCLGLRGWGYYDTMLSEKTLYCGEFPLYAAGYWALKDLVARYFKRELKKTEQKGFDLCTPLREEQIEYAALDIRVPLAIRQKQLIKAEKEGLTRAIQIQNDAIPAFGDMKVNGMLLDQEAWLRIVESNEAKHRENVAALDKYFVPLYGTKESPVIEVTAAEVDLRERAWRDEEDREQRKIRRKEYQEASRKYKARMKDAHLWEGRAALNYASDDQMLQALQKLGYRVVATNEKALSKVKDEPVIKDLFAYRETSKALSTYGRSFLNYIDPETGRIHSNIDQMGAMTGRTAATKPNVQNIPKLQRKCFVARPGYVIVTADMSGAELRIIAELSKDEAWISAFANGWDVHSMGAEMMFGSRWADAALKNCAYYAGRKKCKCPEHEKLRDFVKAINFGVAYGMEKFALAQRLNISIAEAENLLKLWAQVNSNILKYLTKSGNDAKMMLEARTLGGFRRKFLRPDWNRCKQTAIERRVKDGNGPDVSQQDISRVFAGSYGSIEREGKNTPIQGSNAIIAKLAMGAGLDDMGRPYMWHRLNEVGAELINFVHDEWVVESPVEHAEIVKGVVKDCVERAAAEFMTRVVMESEANISERWEK